MLVSFMAPCWRQYWFKSYSPFFLVCLSVSWLCFRNRYINCISIESLAYEVHLLWYAVMKQIFTLKPQTNGSQNALCWFWGTSKRHKLSFQEFWALCSEAGNDSTSWLDIILKFSKCFDFLKTNSSATSFGKFEEVWFFLVGKIFLFEE